MSETRGNAERVTTALVRDNTKHKTRKDVHRSPVSRSIVMGSMCGGCAVGIPSTLVLPGGLLMGMSQFIRPRSIADSLESNEDGDEMNNETNARSYLSYANDTVQRFDN